MPRNSGLFSGMFNDIKPVVRNMAMQSFTLDRNGSFTVTLIDGQVWKQSAEDEVYHPARWRKISAEHNDLADKWLRRSSPRPVCLKNTLNIGNNNLQ